MTDEEQRRAPHAVLGAEPPPLSAEDEAFRASFALLVDFYRLEQRGRLVRAFLPAVLGFVPAGGLLVVLSLTSRLPDVSWSPFVLTLGLVLLACGPLSAIVLLLRSISDDAYVAIRVDGLAVKLNPAGAEELLDWEYIEEVRRAGDAVWIACQDGRLRRIAGPFAEVSLDALAGKIRDARRLAVWNRLRPGVPL